MGAQAAQQIYYECSAPKKLSQVLEYLGIRGVSMPLALSRAFWPERYLVKSFNKSGERDISY